MYRQLPYTTAPFITVQRYARAEYARAQFLCRWQPWDLTLLQCQRSWC